MQNVKRVLFCRNVLLLLIIFFSATLRFYNFPNRVSFDRDASLDALVARAGSNELQLPLTGPFSSAAPITTGPWYYYQMILANLLLPTVYAPWISFAFSSLILVFAMYRIGVLLKDNRFGLLLAVITAISPVELSVSTGLGNASLLGQFAGIIIWLFLEIILNKKGGLFEILLGFMIGLSINYHFQALLLLPFFTFLFYKKESFLVSVFYSFFGLLISFLPLIFFDLNNHWYNLTHAYNFLILGQNAAIEIKRWMLYLPVFWNNLIVSVLGTPKFLSLFILLFGFLANVWILMKSNNKSKTFLLPTIFLCQFIFLRYYRGPLRDNYVQFLHPYIFLFTGSLLYLAPKAIIKSMRRFVKPNKYSIYLMQLLLVAIYLIVTFPAIQKRLEPNLETLKLNSEVINLLKGSNNNNIAVYRCHNSNMTKPWSIALILDLNNKLAKNAKSQMDKIGYVDNLTCAEKYKYKNETVSLSKLKEESLVVEGWEIVTPHTVYESMVKWWYDERP